MAYRISEYDKRGQLLHRQSQEGKIANKEER